MTLEERIAELEAENVALWEQVTVLADLVGADLSLGTLVAWVNQAAATLEPVEASIKAAVSRAAVLPCCETGVRQGGHLACAYVASSHQLTHHAVHPTRGAEATNDISIVSAYQGVSMPDAWKPYRAHTHSPRGSEREAARPARPRRGA